MNRFRFVSQIAEAASYASPKKRICCARTAVVRQITWKSSRSSNCVSKAWLFVYPQLPNLTPLTTWDVEATYQELQDLLFTYLLHSLTTFSVHSYTALNRSISWTKPNFGIGIICTGKVCISTSRIALYANTITMHIRMPRHNTSDHLEKRHHHLKIIHHEQRVRGHLVCVRMRWQM